MYLDFILKVIVISASGVLSPGPLTFSVVSLGLKQGKKVGFLASIGHLLAEFPLVILIALGVYEVLLQESFKRIIGLIGGVMIFVFGALQLRDAFRIKHLELTKEEKSMSSSPILVGFSFSMFNPFFIIWWISVGIVLIYNAIELFGFIGVIYMYLAHVWLDFVWYTFLAYLANMGRKYIKNYGILLATFSVIIIILGLDMIIKTILMPP